MRPWTRILIGVLLVGLVLPSSAETGLARAKLQKYFEALQGGQLERGFRALGVPAKLGKSRWAILNEYQIKDPSVLGRCERNLKTMGEALQKYNTAYVKYPKTLKELPAAYLSTKPTCPLAKGKPYRYERRDDHFFILSCPNGHGRTPGFPLFSSIDGVLSNPKSQLMPYFHVLDERDEEGVPTIRVVGMTSRGPLDTKFAFTPEGDLDASSLVAELEEMLRQMAQAKASRVTKLDTPTFLVGMALMSNDHLIRAAHCRLAQNGMYYQIQGAQRRLGEISFAAVTKHLGKMPTCPATGKAYQLKTLPTGKTRIYCSGEAHRLAGLGADQPSREF